MIPGARLQSPDSARFDVWAPRADRVRILSPGGATVLELDPADGGWYTGTGPAHDGFPYLVQLDDGTPRPDPASRFQPQGVHGPSAVVDLDFEWTDGSWRGIPLGDHIVYELHIGTFTEAGTFDSAVERLDHLVDLGVTTVELMPVAQCPGERNWGYDGVALYATQASYGGPKGLQRFVDACHRRNLAVWLDVVYNHLGPEGNYLPEFGPYFTDRHHTPWGSAVNLDGPDAEYVRRYFIDNARTWISEFHIDGFRLDAVHAFIDDSEIPFLQQLAHEVHDLADRLGRPVHVVVENPLNDPVLITKTEQGGLGLDGGWNDDFHHALHVAFTGETARYYAEFQNALDDLTTAFGEGYVLAGGPTPYRGGRERDIEVELPRDKLVVFAQNHDQVGNRGHGDRLTTLAPPAALRLAAGLVLLSPWVPMLFMGEEWGETRPFLYFVDHGDADLIEAVRAGRRAEFQGFIQGDVPDPAAPETRDRSVLDWSKIDRESHRSLLDLHRTLIEIRKELRSINTPDPRHHHVQRIGTAVISTGEGNGPATLAMFNVAADPVKLDHGHSGWRRVVDGADLRFGGDGVTTPDVLDEAPIDLGPWGFVLYREELH